MGTGDMLRALKAAYAAGVRDAGRLLERIGLLKGSPPPRDARLRHWAYSLTRVYDSLAIAEMDVPWWTYRSIEVVDVWLAALPEPVRVFEFGSGASTLWLSRRAGEVHTVEHHRGFAEHMAPAFGERGNVSLHIVEASRSEHPLVPSAKEGHKGLDFAEYVSTIDKVGGPFSLIVIDGRAREACLAAAVSHLEPNGMVVFDNSWRRRYRTAIIASGLIERRLRGLTPTLPYPDQTSLLTLRSTS